VLCVVFRVCTLMVIEYTPSQTPHFDSKTTSFNTLHGAHTASPGLQHSVKWLLGMSGTYEAAQKGHTVRPSWDNCEKMKSWFTRENGRTCEPLNSVQPNMYTVIDNRNNTHNPLSISRSSDTVMWNTQKSFMIYSLKSHTQRWFEAQHKEHAGNKLLG